MIPFLYLLLYFFKKLFFLLLIPSNLLIPNVCSFAIPPGAIALNDGTLLPVPCGVPEDPPEDPASVGTK